MKKISDVQASSLGRIYHKLAQIKALQKKINDYLPEELRSHCNIANFQNGILVFAIESSAWAMRFRYLIPDLLSSLRKKADLPQLSSIEYYIEPEFSTLFVTES